MKKKNDLYTQNIQIYSYILIIKYRSVWKRRLTVYRRHRSLTPRLLESIPRLDFSTRILRLDSSTRLLDWISRLDSTSWLEFSTRLFDSTPRLEFSTRLLDSISRLDCSIRLLDHTFGRRVEISGVFINAGVLYESLRRKPGWRFTAGTSIESQRSSKALKTKISN